MFYSNTECLTFSHKSLHNSMCDTFQWGTHNEHHFCGLPTRHFTLHRTIYGSGDRFLFNNIQSNDILEGFVFGRTQTWPWCDDAVAEGSSVKKVWPCKSMCNHTEHYQPWQGQTMFGGLRGYQGYIINCIKDIWSTKNDLPHFLVDIYPWLYIWQTILWNQNNAWFCAA